MLWTSCHLSLRSNSNTRFNSNYTRVNRLHRDSRKDRTANENWLNFPTTLTHFTVVLGTKQNAHYFDFAISIFIRVFSPKQKRKARIQFSRGRFRRSFKRIIISRIGSAHKAASLIRLFDRSNPARERLNFNINVVIGPVQIEIRQNGRTKRTPAPSDANTFANYYFAYVLRLRDCCLCVICFVRNWVFRESNGRIRNADFATLDRRVENVLYGINFY